MIRKPAFAGYFYPGQRQELQSQLQAMVIPASERKKVLGLVAPHAGYVYSGRCAGKGFGRVVLTDRVIVMGISHHGSRIPLALDGNDQWETPLGRVDVDHDLRFQLLSQTGMFSLDAESGKMEHSLEVQIPFIQFANPKARILPIMVSTQGEAELLAAGRELGQLLKKNPEVIMVASTDMSHYISAKKAKEVDGLAIERMLALDAKGLLQTVCSHHITMCGVAPTAMMLEAARTAGASQAEVIDYTNSGVVTGDPGEVVAYLSLMVY